MTTATGSAAVALDLGLPTDEQLLSVATPNPRAEAERLTDTGDPTVIGELGRALTESGADMDGLHRASQQAQQRLTTGFHNNGTPVYDEALHRDALPPGFPDAGSQLHAIGRRLGAVGDELAGAIGDVNRSLGQLQADLTARRRAWQAEVEALGGSTGLIPAEAVAGMLARRATIIEQMHEAVSSCGRTVVDRIDGYTGVLNGCLQLLGEFRLPPPRRESGPDTGALRLNGALQPAGSGIQPTHPFADPMITTPGIGGLVEIYPLPAGGGRFEGGHDHPLPPAGPSVDITVPGPPPETRTDQGQLPPNASPLLRMDADSSGTQDGRPSSDNTDESIDETLAGLGEGRTPPHLEVGTPEALQAVWDKLSAQGTPVPSTYPGAFEQLPDGTKIGFRAGSKSGGATIDVFKADGTQIKIHLP